MKLKTLCIVICLIAFSTITYAQTTQITVTDSVPKADSKLRLGLGFGLNFVGGTSISLSPSLAYNVSEKVTLGIGVQGSYNALKNLQKTTTIGGSIFSNYKPIKQITLLLEFVELNVSTKTATPIGDVNISYWDSALFIGAGFNITDKISIGAKYNMLYDKSESVYTSAVIPFVNISF